MKLPDEKRRAKEECNQYADKKICACSSDSLKKKGKKRAHPQSISFGSDCSGLGTDSIVVKKACQQKDIQMDFKFMSEADYNTRRMHSTLGTLHGLKPQKKYSDLAKRGVGFDLDFFMAGPPCQPWTQLAPNSLGVEDKKGRGTVMYHVIHFILTDKPKCFLLENVLGLLTKHAIDFAAILKALDNAGYKLSWSILSPLDSGCPQSRPRIYIFGIRADCCHQPFK